MGAYAFDKSVLGRTLRSEWRYFISRIIRTNSLLILVCQGSWSGEGDVVTGEDSLWWGPAGGWKIVHNPDFKRKT